MNQPTSPNDEAPAEEKRDPLSGAVRGKTLAIVSVLVGFVVWAHLGSGVRVFRSQVSSEPGWEKFSADYEVNYFGDDGQFVRAVQSGYNLVFYTYKYAPRFTRRTASDRVNACGACHTAEDLAYAFVNSDRFDTKLGMRVSFEDRVRRCYAGAMNGFVPTIYDPAVRDIRLFARAVAHHLQLGEGAVRKAK
jgi:cytochrome c